MDKTTFTTGADNQSLVVKHSYNSVLEKVWDAWTKSELLDQWWAPAPWKAVTKSFDFSEGGLWHYYMQSPEGEKHWCKVQYKTIDPQKSFSAFDAFCDENGTINPDLPGNDWMNEFIAEGEQTHLTVTLTFKSPEDMQKIVEMGFKEGFSMGLDQLETLLQQ